MTIPQLAALLLLIQSSSTLQIQDDLLGSVKPSETVRGFLTLPGKLEDEVLFWPSERELNEIEAHFNGSKLGFDAWKNVLLRYLYSEFRIGPDKSSADEADRLDSEIFDRISHERHFKAMRVAPEVFDELVSEKIKGMFLKIAENQTWFPTDTMLRELDDCSYLNYGKAGSDNFQYDKEIGGEITLYRLSCMKTGSEYLVVFYAQHTDFHLKDIERIDTVGEGTQTKRFLFWKRQSKWIEKCKTVEKR